MSSAIRLSRFIQYATLMMWVMQPLCTHAASEYVRLEQYYRQHPDQHNVASHFADAVREDAIPAQLNTDSPVKIALVYPGIQASDYWRRSQTALEKRLGDLKIPFELRSFFSHPSVDTALQSRQLARALEWQPDYLAFTLDVAPQGRMIERILAQGKPKLILQNITTPLVDWQSYPPFLYVGFDHAEGTKLMANWMLEKINYRGKYLLLYFSPGYVSQMRGDTFAAEAARYAEVQQVAAYYTDGQQERAYQATLDTLKQNPDLKMIFACSTDVALGALRALREMGRTDVLLNGWGGGAAELEALGHEGLDLTVMRINDDNGIAMAEAIKLDLLQRAEQVPHVFAGELRLIDTDMPPESLQKLIEQAFRLSDTTDAPQ
ncbi:Autoinducer 2-binding periplasmic protein LuxP precursor [Marinobacterium lacunae]|uniref:Autoinducer 2-binding periplasmic protein LuxP n=1 Tax=Marinobacterium lacunae TaxID=1232683 RepID=A0A081FTK8_9GAMM|nr:substrate-binding domain-containing protein [Marinobacterium lacunae]KEA61863.1 Autoinducer 2-binding periplasmic protein LuxP precursor [Marinobacterium lacunae]MBR9883413.1 substrate-binding domain-containing protein [Oceanospirillales bacterium]